MISLFILDIRPSKVSPLNSHDFPMIYAETRGIAIRQYHCLQALVAEDHQGSYVNSD
jgi:hypothetical protein